MYYFLTGKTLNLTTVPDIVNRKSPKEFVARAPDNIIRHFKDGQIVEEERIYSKDPEDLRIQSSQIARRMLSGMRMRKHKKVKTRCKCKK